MTKIFLSCVMLACCTALHAENPSGQPAAVSIVETQLTNIDNDTNTSPDAVIARKQALLAPLIAAERAALAAASQAPVVE
ncbi:MAG: hypothetical protein ACREKL_10890, partial [Chthoniobacterales bacterium]